MKIAEPLGGALKRAAELQLGERPDGLNVRDPGPDGDRAGTETSSANVLIERQRVAFESVQVGPPLQTRQASRATGLEAVGAHA